MGRSQDWIRRLALLLLALPGDALAQRVAVSGRVVDADRQPVPFANIEVVKQGRYVADDSGHFSVRVVAGALVINVLRLGYQPASASVRIARDTVIEFVMLPVATMLAGQQIAARAMTRLSNIGFYTRLRDRERGMNSGWFITSEQIEARHPLETSQLLGSIPGMRMQAVRGACTR